MNAVPTLPIQPEMPVAGTSTPGPRDDDPCRHASTTAPNFMTALHKVSADKPSQASPDDQRDVPPSPSEEDQPIALQAEASLPATDGGDPQTMVLIKGEMTSALPGHDTHDLRGAAISNGQLTGAAKATVVATATVTEDQQGVARPPVSEAHEA